MLHIIVGDEAAKNLKAAFELDENLQGEILVLKDTLGIGDLLSTPEISHDSIRTSWWKTIVPHFDEEVSDESRLLAFIDNAIEQEEPVCFWLSPCVSDVCAYYWLLSYFKPHSGLLHTINIIGLPFLNEKGQLFYPINFSQVPPKEFIKTKRLLKEVTIAEYEVEIDEWKRLQEDNTWVRLYEGGKKIVSKPMTYFDTFIKNSVSDEMQKASKIVHESMKKITQTLSPAYIEYRLKQLLQQDVFQFNGLVEGPLKEIEVKNKGNDETSNDIVES
ncbi:MAG: DUF1835 domain-containing protein [Bacteroidetes bacterium]|nr:DUF1835 domain-containing protein [Bacteroidota bacterium]MBK9483135.1 DUF1835 domain-containing protein [Bacteroidota bacterium]HMT34507.1 DUF3658 domain-containing protein [Chitinophagaceae bacterium]